MPVKTVRGLWLPCCLVLLLSVAPAAQAAWWWPFGKKSIDYTIVITGVDTNTRQWLTELKLDQPTESNPPANAEQLEQEAVALGAQLRKALQAKGFYDAIIRQSADLSAKPPVLRYAVQPGGRYFIRAVRVAWPDTKRRTGKTLVPIAPRTLKTKAGMPVDAAMIQDDALAIVKQIDQASCLLSLDVTPVLELPGGHRADLVFRVAHGPSADFGKPVISGTRDVSNSVVLRAVSWKQGECFKRSKIDTTQTSLIQNQLFSSVRVTPAAVVDANGQVPITITLKERVPRTVTAGTNYSTDQGFGVTAGWEHRNLFGHAEKFNADVVAAEQEQSVNTNLRIPAFLRNDQTLALNAGIERQNTDAYTTQSVTSGATVERRLTPALNSGLGVAYTLTKTDDPLGSSQNYGLLSLPGFLTYDTRDNALDTRKGWLGNLIATPYTDTFGDGGQFLKTQTNVQTYFSSEKKYKPTLAFKLTLGGIYGADGQDVPSDIRFYAGGGGSVRGYSYQSLSPRVNGESVGGSSLAVASSEIRLRFTETIGAVAFVDAGNAYDAPFPEIGKDVFYGAGVGTRYYSPIGPLRIDVAVPLNGKEIGETGYGLYVSLGQAF